MIGVFFYPFVGEFGQYFFLNCKNFDFEVNSDVFLDRVVGTEAEFVACACSLELRVNFVGDSAASYRIQIVVGGESWE